MWIPFAIPIMLMMVAEMVVLVQCLVKVVAEAEVALAVAEALVAAVQVQLHRKSPLHVHQYPDLYQQNLEN